MRYLQREGVAEENQPAQLYNAHDEEADGKALLERSDGDRHQFRFIVSSEDANELTDLKPLTLSDVQCFEMEELMHETGAVLPVLTYLFHRLEERFDGRPSLLILDEAWLFLDHPTFAARIREWLKTLRKKNVSVIFATQGLSDIAGSSIVPAIIESCPSRIFLPNDRAIEPQSKTIYEAFGLNDRQIEIIAQATPKRDYYFQSRQGNRLFDLSLGPVALAFVGATSKQDHALMDEMIGAHGIEEFADSWLRAKDLDWAADIITPPTINLKF